MGVVMSYGEPQSRVGLRLDDFSLILKDFYRWAEYFACLQESFLKLNLLVFACWLYSMVYVVSGVFRLIQRGVLYRTSPLKQANCLLPDHSVSHSRFRPKSSAISGAPSLMAKHRA